MPNKDIHVTAPSLAPLSEFVDLLNGVWERGILTHNGPLVRAFEAELCSRLGLPSFVAVSNGTVAIQMAIKALGLKGEIITTPFTWVATLSAIQWEGCSPVFCDIDPETLNIDPRSIESLITDETVAIMPVHVFGNPCDVHAIQAIAERNGLRVIYDAAHAVGSTLSGQSLLSFGDISATSLHATKLLNTAEGGGCVSLDQELRQKLERIRFFGHDDTKDVVEPGFNGKLTEIHAALGLANLKYLEDVLLDRLAKWSLYHESLSSVGDIGFQRLSDPGANRSYFPIILSSEDQLRRVVDRLSAEYIFPRRYFFPSINTLSKLVEYTPCPISEDVARRILCLPLHLGIGLDDVVRISGLVRSAIR